MQVTATYTNTDAKSEFNTLIDPVVAKQIAEFEHLNGEKIEAMVVEVSEVQGWLDKLMKDHARLMTSAVDPQCTCTHQCESGSYRSCEFH